MREPQYNKPKKEAGNPVGGSFEQENLDAAFKELQALRKEQQDLKEENRILNQQLSFASAEISRLKGHNKNANDTSTNLWDSAGAEIDAALAELQENETLKSEIKALNQQVSDFENKVQQISKELTEKKAEIAKLLIELAQAKVEYDAAKQTLQNEKTEEVNRVKLEKVQAEKRHKEKEAISDETLIAQLENIQSKEKALEQLNCLIQELETAAQEQEAQSNARYEELDKKYQEVVDARILLEEKITQTETDSEEAKNRWEQERASLTEKYAILEQEKNEVAQQLENEKQSHQDDLADNSEKIKALTEELEELTHRYEALDQEKNRVTQQWDSEKASHQKHIAEYTDQAELYQGIITAREVAIQAIEDNLKETKEQNAQALQEAQSAQDLLKKQLEALANNLKQQQEEHARIVSELEQKTINLSEIISAQSQAIQLKEADISRLKNENQELIALSNEQSELVERVNTEAENQKTQYCQLRQEYESTITQRNDLQEKLTKAQEDKERQQKALELRAKKNAELAVKNAQLTETLTAEKTSHEADLSRDKKKNDTLEQEKLQILQQLENEKYAHENDTHSAQERIAAQTNEIALLQTELNSQQKALSKAEEINQSNREMLEKEQVAKIDLQKNLANLTDCYTQLEQEKVETAQRLVNEETAHQTDNARAQKKIEQLTDQVQSQQTAFNAKIQTLQAAKDKLENIQNENNVALEIANAAQDSLQEEINEKEAVIKKLANELSQEKETATHTISVQKAEIDSKQSTIEQLLARIQGLEKANANLSAENENQKNTIDLFSTENATLQRKNAALTEQVKREEYARENDVLQAQEQIGALKLESGRLIKQIRHNEEVAKATENKYQNALAEKDQKNKALSEYIEALEIDKEVERTLYRDEKTLQGIWQERLQDIQQNSKRLQEIQENRKRVKDIESLVANRKLFAEQCKLIRISDTDLKQVGLAYETLYSLKTEKELANVRIEKNDSIEKLNQKVQKLDSLLQIEKQINEKVETIRRPVERNCETQLAKVVVEYAAKNWIKEAQTARAKATPAWNIFAQLFNKIQNYQDALLVKTMLSCLEKTESKDQAAQVYVLFKKEVGKKSRKEADLLVKEDSRLKKNGIEIDKPGFQHGITLDDYHTFQQAQTRKNRI